MRLRLDEDELSCLRQLSSACPDISNALNDAMQLRKDGFIEIGDEVADKLRDMCGDELQSDGFDEDYEPTKRGRMLEKLIDKLYIG